MPAMIVMKQTPQGFKLIPATECRDNLFRKMMRSDSMAFRTQEVMDMLMRVAKSHRLYKTTLKELFDLTVRTYGDGQLSPMRDVQLLPASGKTQARLLIQP